MKVLNVLKCLEPFDVEKPVIEHIALWQHISVRHLVSLACFVHPDAACNRGWPGGRSQETAAVLQALNLLFTTFQQLYVCVYTNTLYIYIALHVFMYAFVCICCMSTCGKITFLPLFFSDYVSEGVLIYV